MKRKQAVLYTVLEEGGGGHIAYCSWYTRSWFRCTVREYSVLWFVSWLNDVLDVLGADPTENLREMAPVFACVRESHVEITSVKANNVEYMARAVLLLQVTCIGGVLDRRDGRSRMTIDPRIPTMPGRSISGFHRPGRHCLHQARSAVRCPASRMKGELHPTKTRF